MSYSSLFMILLLSALLACLVNGKTVIGSICGLNLWLVCPACLFCWWEWRDFDNNSRTADRSTVLAFVSVGGVGELGSVIVPTALPPPPPIINNEEEVLMAEELTSLFLGISPPVVAITSTNDDAVIDNDSLLPTSSFLLWCFALSRRLFFIPSLFHHGNHLCSYYYYFHSRWSTHIIWYRGNNCPFIEPGRKAIIHNLQSKSSSYLNSTHCIIRKILRNGCVAVEVDLSNNYNIVGNINS